MKTKVKPRTSTALHRVAKRYTLNDALHYMQENNIVITKTSTNLELWCPGKVVPENIKSVLYTHYGEIKAMMAKSDIRVCVDAMLHRQEWCHLEGNDYRCCICCRIAV